MEIAAGNHFAGVGENQRIVGRRIHLDFDRFPGPAHCVFGRAMHLRHAAQRIGILHFAAVFMRLHDSAVRR